MLVIILYILTSLNVYYAKLKKPKPKNALQRFARYKHSMQATKSLYVAYIA